MDTTSPAARSLYERCVREHGPALYRLAFRLCGRRDLADDLTQETFCEAWKSLSTLSDPAKAKPWLFQILRFRWSHYLRERSRRIRTTAEQDVAADADSANCIDRLADVDLLFSVLACMDPVLKAPLLLTVAEGYTCRETAGALQIPLGTVLSRIHRAKAVLRERFRSCASLSPA